MKIIAVGDVHGRDHWKKIEPDYYDRIVFVGDYVDNLSIDNDTILKNLKAIIALKNKFPEKVILLLGNHDIQYSEYPTDYRCSGFSEEMQPAYTKLFTENKSLFQVAAQFGDYLFTHAGLSLNFVQHSLMPWSESILEKKLNVADLLNYIHDSDQQYLLHTVGKARGGSDPFGGITWADVSETCTSLLPGYHEVVGHTPVKRIRKIGNGVSSITYIDTQNNFYEIKFT
ncbi:MAG: serine/threonine protein phosphatase [Bacteroidota bacterium]|nr:MAG: serine/threonine protein phosphatase [Bacteroidota bacterium]